MVMLRATGKSCLPGYSGNASLNKTTRGKYGVYQWIKKYELTGAAKIERKESRSAFYFFNELVSFAIVLKRGE
jgi:hypothetical protein